TFTAANIGVNPLLQTINYYGGFTKTFAVRAGSPAIDHGSNPASLTTDQRSGGFLRIVGGAADIGAYERQSTNLKVLNTNDSGTGSLRQALLDAMTNPNPFDSITFDSTAFATQKTISLLTPLPLANFSHDLVVTGTGASL